MQTNNKYLVYGVVIVVLIVVAVLAISKYNNASKQTAQPNGKNLKIAQNMAVPPAAQVTTIASAQIPSLMPAGLPWEDNAQILQNSEVKDPSTGKTHVSRSYISAKSLDANYSTYQKFIQTDGWVLSSSVNQPTVKNLVATKSGNELSITISSNTQKQVTVSVVYSY
ncbi:MAG: hypothetical protein P4L74_02045 [Candidatus Doudnabacteria bacterium]|nr:hypothetical protein [Candidatus Doudnabacteria bacterium]